MFGEILTSNYLFHLLFKKERKKVLYLNITLFELFTPGQPWALTHAIV